MLRRKATIQHSSLDIYLSTRVPFLDPLRITLAMPPEQSSESQSMVLSNKGLEELKESVKRLSVDNNN
jgi:hypothetical protein